MRQKAEDKVWRSLQRARLGSDPTLFKHGERAEIDLAYPCTILGGRNGSGKSRLLRSIASDANQNSLYLDLHHLIEQAMTVLRSLNDVKAMKDELGRVGPDTSRFDDIKRVVGRDYDAVNWFALDVGPTDPVIAKKFHWAGDDEDDPITPYFTVDYGGTEYDALEMGLGEFSVHFLFWILEQYKGRDDLLLLLDEPDAYLPPIGVERLLVRLLTICQQRGWRLILSTHS